VGVDGGPVTTTRPDTGVCLGVGFRVDSLAC